MTATLHHGDALAHPEWWTAADVLVTDPPYGIGWRSHGGGNGRTQTVRDPGIVGDQDTTARDRALELWGSRPALVFGSPMRPPPPGTRQVLVWKKGPGAGLIGSTTGWRTDWEAVYVVGDWPTVTARASSVIESAVSHRLTVTAVGHPHAKPVALLAKLLTMCPPGVVADPFAGSGSTLVAAQMMGRDAVGVEIDARYHAMAAARLAQDVLPAAP